MVICIFSIRYDHYYILLMNPYVFLKYDIFGILYPDKMTSKLMSPLVSWGNGTVMIAIFTVVCVVLVGTVIAMMSANKKKEE